jgi:hypothetical protein
MYMSNDSSLGVGDAARLMWDMPSFTI